MTAVRLHSYVPSLLYLSIRRLCSFSRFSCLFLFSLHLYSFPFFFFLNDTAPPEIYPLPLHAALPIPDVDGRDQDVDRRARLANRAKQRLLVELPEAGPGALGKERTAAAQPADPHPAAVRAHRSEEHTSELQSRSDLVCRLLLEKKKKQ